MHHCDINLVNIEQCWLVGAESANEQDGWPNQFC